MTPPLLSACMIMRDEEAVLDACLTSLDGLVDEVVIVDTGSVDRSIEIASFHQARILHRPWDDDFATPRNLGLDHATGAWILYIDADERLSGVDRQSLERLLTDAPEIGFRVLLRPEAGMTPYLEYRLWRNDPRIRFEGAIHERVVSAIHQVGAAEGRPVSDCLDVLLEHVGYEGDQRRKHLRNLPILERVVRDCPDHVFARHHLATVLDGLGRASEAEALLEETVEAVRRRTPADRDGVLSFASLIGMRRAAGKEYRALLAEACRLYPDNAVLLFIDGEDLAARGEFAAALARFDAVVEIGSAPITPTTPAYDQALIGERSQAARGFCLFKLGRFDAAAQAYAAALLEAPGDLSYEVKRRLCLSRVGVGARSDQDDAAVGSVRPEPIRGTKGFGHRGLGPGPQERADEEDR